MMMVVIYKCTIVESHTRSCQ